MWRRTSDSEKVVRKDVVVLWSTQDRDTDQNKQDGYLLDGWQAFCLSETLRGTLQLSRSLQDSYTLRNLFMSQWYLSLITTMPSMLWQILPQYRQMGILFMQSSQTKQWRKEKYFRKRNLMILKGFRYRHSLEMYIYYAWIQLAEYVNNVTQTRVCLTKSVICIRWQGTGLISREIWSGEDTLPIIQIF